MDKNIGFHTEKYAGPCDVRQAMRLYAVTDRAWVGRQTLIEQVADAIAGGATCVQLREKHLGDSDFLTEARDIAGLCHAHRVPLVINDNVDVAVACGADGIHVGQNDMPADEVRRIVGDKLFIGVSAHTVEEAIAAEKAGADCLGLGAVFATGTKTDVDVMMRDTLIAITDAVDIPCVAIGGIKADNVASLAGTGVDGVAIVSAIFGADDITSACKELRALSDAMVDA